MINKPNWIGSSVFFFDCGNPLPKPGSEYEIECNQCVRKEQGKLQEDVTLTTWSHPTAFPSSLRQKFGLVQQTNIETGAGQITPLMDKTCPKWKHPHMIYHTLK